MSIGEQPGCIKSKWHHMVIEQERGRSGMRGDAKNIMKESRSFWVKYYPLLITDDTALELNLE